MYSSESKIRVRYAETDQMGFAYYGNYAQYYEVARADAMRSLGMTYRQMEELGIFMPIVSMQSNYLKPARYDDLLTVKAIVNEMPASRIKFLYEVYNEAGTLLNRGDTILAFIRKDSGRPCPAPEWFLEKLSHAFNDLHNK